jgi:uncharacterized protein (DUF952 family)
MIYKIFRSAEWAALQSKGETAGAPIDVQDGYVHFSTAAQTAETLAKHFAGEDELFLLSVDEATLGDDLRWEKSRGDQLFPHLYRALKMADIVTCQPIRLMEDGTHLLPDNVT